MKYHLFSNVSTIVATCDAADYDIDAATDFFFVDELADAEIDCISDHITIVRFATAPSQYPASTVFVVALDDITPTPDLFE